MYFRCGPNKLGQAIFRSYGRFFAEFLEDLSLVHLGLLALITCVGLRYGVLMVMLRSFSWKRAPVYLVQPKPSHLCSTWIDAWRIYLPHVLIAQTQIQ